MNPMYLCGTDATSDAVIRYAIPESQIIELASTSANVVDAAVSFDGSIYHLADARVLNGAAAVAFLRGVT